MFIGFAGDVLDYYYYGYVRVPDKYFYLFAF